MSTRLVVALGNPLIPADSVGLDVIDTLARDARFANNVDFVIAGTDLLRAAEQLRGRELIVFIDAAASRGKAGEVRVFDHGSPALATAQCDAHHLSAVQALDLLRWSDPQMARTRCVWVLITTTQLANS